LEKLSRIVREFVMIEGSASCTCLGMGERERIPNERQGDLLYNKKTPANTKRRSEMRISARNVLKGKVKKVAHGVVNSEVIVELAGGVEVVSIITKASAEGLGLAKGKEVYAVIKASNVMIALD
jgi:molybdopterin-binding protein